MASKLAVALVALLCVAAVSAQDAPAPAPAAPAPFTEAALGPLEVVFGPGPEDAFSILDALLSSDEHLIFLDVVLELNLTDLLNDPFSNITVFAPTDYAFEFVLNKTIDTEHFLVGDNGSYEPTYAIAEYAIVPQVIDIAQLLAGSGDFITLPTLAGNATLEVLTEEGSPVVASNYVGSFVHEWDGHTLPTHSKLYSIDSVLIPPQAVDEIGLVDYPGE